MQASMEEDV